MKKLVIIIMILAAICYGDTVAPEVDGFPINLGVDSLTTPTSLVIEDEIFIGIGSYSGEFSIVNINDASDVSVDLDGPITHAASIIDNSFVVQTTNGLVYRIGIDGEIYSGFPVDLDGESKYSGTCVNLDYGIIAICDNEVFIISGSGGVTTLASFDSEYGAVASPACGDIDSDGIPDVIIAGWDKLFAFSLEDGSSVDEFPVELGGSYRFSYSSPTIADIGQDGDLQVILGCHQTADDYYGAIAVASAGTGMDLSYPISIADTGSWIYSTPVPADVDTDYVPEISFTCINGYIYQLESTPDWLDTWYNSGGSLEGTALIADLNRDWEPDYCFTSKDSGFVQRRTSVGLYTDTMLFVNDSVSYGFVSPVICCNSENWYIVAASLEGIVDIWQLEENPVIGSEKWLHDRGNSYCDGVYPEPVSSIEARDIGGEFRVSWDDPLANALPIETYKLYLTNPDDTSETDFQLIYEGLNNSFIVEAYIDSQDVQIVVEYTNGTVSKGRRLELIYGMGIDENNAPIEYTMDISPNPFNSTTSIRTPENTVYVEIIDINCKVINTYIANGNSITITMNAESGVYLARAISRDGEVLSCERMVYLK